MPFTPYRRKSMNRLSFELSRKLTLAVTLSVVLLIAACSAAGTSAGAAANADSAADTAAIRQVAKTYEDAYNRKDVAAISALHADDFVGLLSNGKLVKSRADNEAALATDTATWGKLTITPNEPVGISGNLGWGSGTTVAQVAMPGGKAVSIPGAYLVTLRKDAGTWKIVSLAGISDSVTLASLAAPPANASKTGKK
jgi:ketosteroid isomerase-like protein